jgi:hypothetical protein
MGWPSPHVPSSFEFFQAAGRILSWDELRPWFGGHDGVPSLRGRLEQFCGTFDAQIKCETGNFPGIWTALHLNHSAATLPCRPASLLTGFPPQGNENARYEAEDQRLAADASWSAMPRCEGAGAVHRKPTSAAWHLPSTAL